MDRTISLQAAIDALRNMAVPLEHDPVCENIWERDRTLDNAIDAVRALPSAQSEVIRCRDCKYYHPAYCEVWSRYGTVQTREAGYCYMAERREE